MTKPETQKTEATNRRDFLKLAGTTAPVAAVALAAGTNAAEANPVDLASEKMQDTAHTRAYLDSARF
jgi:hypothetical protein